MASTFFRRLSARKVAGTRFHREVLLPDVQRVVSDLRAEMNQRFASLDGHFDAIYQRFDKLETEYHMLVAGLKRVD